MRLKPDGARGRIRAPRRRGLRARRGAQGARRGERARARRSAARATDWGVDFAPYKLLEQSQQTQIIRPRRSQLHVRAPRAARRRARPADARRVAGDELTGIAPFVHIPRVVRPALRRAAQRQQPDRESRERVGGRALRHRRLHPRRAVARARSTGSSGARRSARGSSSARCSRRARWPRRPAAWFGADTTETATTFWAKQGGVALLIAVAGGLAYALVFMAAESLTRRAFPHHPQLWRVWSRDAAPTPQIAGRTLGGYLFVPIELALVARVLLRDEPLARLVAAVRGADRSQHPRLGDAGADADRDLAAGGLHGGVRVPRDPAVARRADRRALRPPDARHRVAVVLQALVFGGAHANYPGFPAYSRPVELVLPSIAWALIFLRFGLLPTILLHATFDLVAVLDSALPRRRARRARAAGAGDRRAAARAAADRRVAPLAGRRVARVARRASQRRVARPAPQRPARRRSSALADRSRVRRDSSARCRRSASPASPPGSCSRRCTPTCRRLHRPRARRSPLPTPRSPRRA